MASNDPDRQEEAAAGDDEDTGAQIAPIVTLSEVAVTTGEEEEDVLLDLKAKLYRFDKDGNQWKERGSGSVKLLKHTETGKVRLVMRQAKTLKICANHLGGPHVSVLGFWFYVYRRIGVCNFVVAVSVVPSIKIQEHAGNDKSCVWHASDFADGELKEEMFCIRFGSVENCKKFMEMIESITESLGEREEEESEDAAAAAAGLLDKLSVDGSQKAKAAAAEEEVAAKVEAKAEQSTKSED
ncbi:ran-binding protein 1 homolog b-like isoform X1 [Musa acuminata AAA Group]|uniref:ran-binding protein 1 homolog b-like isoform X1 n=1 Tax=Musa acuminata AAA Group TaxID=214697 RepID=UPI0031D0461C